MIKSLKLYNFRNIAELILTFSNKPKVIVGKNGSGKTNILESIFYSSHTDSFKSVNKLTDFIGSNDKFTNVETIWEDESIINQIIAYTEDNSINRQAKLNGKKIKSSILPYRFPVLFFSPSLVDVLHSEPSLRRKDLDNFLATTDTSYASLILKYKNIHKNRNALIKMIRDNRAKRDELTFWSEKLAEISDNIVNFRNTFFANADNFINISSKNIYNDFHDFSVRYLPNIPVEDHKYLLMQKFEENQQKEIIVGKTLYGSHKDDYEIILNNQNIRFFGSRGQQRIAALILKVAQLEYLKTLNSKNAILLVDDVFSELDPDHKEKLSDFLLKSNNQLIVTSADFQELPKHLINQSEVFDFS